MREDNLERLLNPSSIAVVGASDRRGSIGRSLLENFRNEGYPGEVFPINPKRDRILGLKAYPALTDVGRPIDLAVIMTRIDTVPGIIRECSTLGVGGAIVISSGGKEAGEQGRLIEAEILREAQAGGVRVLGPNCLGVLNTRSRMNASFGHVLPKEGNLALISQSGGTTTAFLDFARTEEIGFSYFISVGSMVDIDFGDVVRYLGDDPHTSAVLIYAESIPNLHKFLTIADSVTRIKPVMLLKVGRCPHGAQAARSHTGALAGDDAVHDAAFSRVGIVRVDTLDDLYDTALMLAKQPLPKSTALAIVTNTGGPGIMAVDHLYSLGYELPQMRPETTEQLNAILSPFWSKGNPADILGDASPEVFRRAAEICAAAPEFDALLLMNTPQAQVPSTDRARALCEAFKGADLPVFSAWVGTQEVAESHRLFREAGIPGYETPERAVRAYLYAYRHEELLHIRRQGPAEPPVRSAFDLSRAQAVVEAALKSKRRLLTEVESKAVLDSFGIPATPIKQAATVEQAIAYAEELDFPVVLKLDSEEISHKSEGGGVKLDLGSAEEVRGAFHEILAAARAYDPRARVAGVTVQPMVRAAGYEVILGAKQDPDFGPVILFGMGGVLAELLQDRAIDLPPLNRTLARRLMASTKVYRLLQGFRGRPGADLPLLEEILVRLSRLVERLPEVLELDINPLLAHEHGAVALDARIVVAPAQYPAPRHLALGRGPKEPGGQNWS
jgi:acetyltransferase